MDSIGDMMLRDIAEYAASTVEECEKIARDVQKHMKENIAPLTPYGKGDRSGHLRDSWGTATVRIGDRTASAMYGGSKINLDRRIYGVYSRTKPQLVHLLEFPHRIVVHGQDTGKMTTARPFVDYISRQGQEELDRRLEEYFRRVNG